MSINLRHIYNKPVDADYVSDGYVALHAHPALEEIAQHTDDLGKIKEIYYLTMACRETHDKAASNLAGQDGIGKSKAHAHTLGKLGDDELVKHLLERKNFLEQQFYNKK